MKKLLLIGLATLLLAVPVALASSLPAYASAFESSNAADQACAGINGTADSGNCSAPGVSLTNVIRTVLNLLSAVIGVAAVVMVMVGGFRYVTSGGDAGKTSGAKSTIVYAIIGLIIVAMAQFMTQFVLHEVTNTTTTKKSTSKSV